MKPLYLVFLIAIGYLFIGNISKEKIVIPEESLRFRIIANSNDSYDQLIKLKLKHAVEEKIISLTSNATNEIEVFNILKDNLENIDSIIKKTFKTENYLKPYKISLGKNYFPSKELSGVKYEEGMYESLVITIGDGLGENWWCVLFPPLCLIEASESTEVEYYFYVKEVLDKYI